ncbi:MAG: hypothetical protein H0V82_04725 [Candidatus Protochlamydia sp.]|nr:hypothetical protein [Candidatus Protochlamydia sp.]
MNQINYSPTSHKHYNEKDCLGFHNVVACFTSQYLLMPNEYGCEFIANKLNKIAKKVYWELRSVLYISREHKERINQLEHMFMQQSKEIVFQDVTPFEQMCAIDDWFSHHTPLRNSFTFYLSSRTKSHGHYLYHSISANFTRRKHDIYSLMQLMLGSGTGAPKYYDDKNLKIDTLDKQDPFQNKYAAYIYPLEALEIVRQPKFIFSTLLKGNSFEAELIDEDIRYGVIENGTIRPTACIEIIGQNKLNWECELIKIRSAASTLFIIDQIFHLKGLKEEDSNICSNTDYENHSLFVTPRKILEALKDSLISQNKERGDQNLYQLIFKMFVVKIGVQSTLSLHNHIISKLENFENI